MIYGLFSVLEGISEQKANFDHLPLPFQWLISTYAYCLPSHGERRYFCHHGMFRHLQKRRCSPQSYSRCLSFPSITLKTGFISISLEGWGFWHPAVSASTLLPWCFSDPYHGGPLHGLLLLLLSPKKPVVGWFLPHLQFTLFETSTVGPALGATVQPLEASVAPSAPPLNPACRRGLVRLIQHCLPKLGTSNLKLKPP